MEDWVFRMVDYGGYIGVFFLMLAETLFPPIPSEVIMPAAGILAGKGALNLTGVIATGTAGAMTGNLFWYAVARSIGLIRFKDFIEQYGRWLSLGWTDVERVERLFPRFGSGIVMFGRIVPTIRSVVSLPAGLLRMHLAKYLLWSAIGTALWSSGLAVAGWYLGKQFHRIEDFVGPISLAIVIAMIFMYVWRQATWKAVPSKDLS